MSAKPGNGTPFNTIRFTVPFYFEKRVAVCYHSFHCVILFCKNKNKTKNGTLLVIHRIVLFWQTGQRLQCITLSHHILCCFILENGRPFTLYNFISSYAVPFYSAKWDTVYYFWFHCVILLWKWDIVYYHSFTVSFYCSKQDTSYYRRFHCAISPWETGHFLLRLISLCPFLAGNGTLFMIIEFAVSSCICDNAYYHCFTVTFYY